MSLSPAGADGGLQAVLFDFDGTLVDTEWPIFLRARLAVANLGSTIELTESLWAAHAVGTAGEAYWLTLRGEVGLGEEVEVHHWHAAYAAVDEDVAPHARHASPLQAGARELVASLRAAGVPMAVASSSPAEWLEHHLGRFDLAHAFDAVVGLDHPDVVHGKPAPDIYRAACAALGVDPVATVAIEDTHHGIDAARAAGVGAVVGVPSALTSHQDLSRADVLVGSLEDLSVDALAALVT